jgi:hypothetical protein
MAAIAARLFDALLWVVRLPIACAFACVIVALLKLKQLYYRIVVWPRDRRLP